MSEIEYLESKVNNNSKKTTRGLRQKKKKKQKRETRTGKNLITYLATDD